MKTISFRADKELEEKLERESERRHLPISTTAQTLLVEHLRDCEGDLSDPSDDESRKNEENEIDELDGKAKEMAEELAPISDQALSIIKENEYLIEESKRDRYRIDVPEAASYTDSSKRLKTAKGAFKNLVRFHHLFDEENDESEPSASEAKAAVDDIL